MLKAMPVLPPLPKVGRKAPRPMRRDDPEAILSVTNAEGRLAFELAAFTGLRASELRRLRWSDVDLKIGIITVRRGITLGIEVTPKSHHQRVIQIGPRLRAALGTAEPNKKSPWRLWRSRRSASPGASQASTKRSNALKSVLGAAVGISTTYATSS
jgi:integrase